MTGPRLAFVTAHDPRDVRTWSGIPLHMARALEQQGVALTHIGPLASRITPAERIRRRISRYAGCSYLPDRDTRLVRAYASEVSARLADMEVDAVFSPGSIPIALLDTRLPIVFWTDATFAGMANYYADFSNLCARSVRVGHELERAALGRAAGAFYASEWAARSAVRDYGASPDKVHVLAFGANLDGLPDRETVALAAAGRSRQACRLLFLGVDWPRKGGDLVLALTAELVARGIPTRLTVAGPPEATVPSSPLVDYVGFVDKSTDAGRARLAHLLGESHFLCLPSRAEAFGIVFCEASAYGVPSVTVRTGGIESAVADGKNGMVLESESFVSDAADRIAALWGDFEGSYVPLALASRAEYEGRLNWASSVKVLVAKIAGMTARPDTMAPPPDAGEARPARLGAPHSARG